MVNRKERFKHYLMKKYELTEEEAEGMVKYLEEQEREALKQFGERVDLNDPDNWALLLSIGFGVLSALSLVKWLFSLGHSSSTHKKTKKGEEREREEVYF